MDFVPYFIRPHSILGTTLWDYWYRSHVFKDTFGFVFGDSVSFGIPAGISFFVHSYKRKCDLDQLKKVAVELVKRNPKKCLDMLKEGSSIQQKVLAGEYRYSNDIAEDYAKVAIYTAVLPYFWFNQTDQMDVLHHAEIQALCVHLRSKNVYSIYFDTVIVPYLVSLTGLEEKEVCSLMYTEIQSGHRRIVHAGFVYTYSNGVESIELKTEHEVKEKIGALKYISDDLEISCTVLGSGFNDVEGIARLVANDLSVFEGGEILVVSSLDERYVSLIPKAKAIVCEDGGLMAHVSYIKNLGIPVCTSVKDITLRIKSGDKILVEPGKFRVRLVHE